MPILPELVISALGIIQCQPIPLATTISHLGIAPILLMDFPMPSLLDKALITTLPTPSYLVIAVSLNSLPLV